MRKKTKLIIIIASIVTVLATAAIFSVIKIQESKEYYTHPTYYSYNNRSDVMVDGIEYKAGCQLDSRQIGEMIGFLDDTRYPIYRLEEDTSHNFLYVKVLTSDMPGYWGFYRSDFVFPKASADTVDRLGWWDATSRKSTTVTDQTIISEFFDYVSSAREYTQTNKTANLYAQVNLYFIDAPGLSEELFICVRKDGSFYCSFMKEGVNMRIDIPADFIEHIASLK